LYVRNQQDGHHKRTVHYSSVVQVNKTKASTCMFTGYDRNYIDK